MLENNKLIELYSHRILGWKGPTRIIGYNSILITWLSKLNSRIKASFRYSLTSERFGAVGRLFQGPAIFSVKNLFLNFPWSSFIPLSCVLLLVTRERRSAPPLLCLPWGRCTLLSSPPLSLLSSKLNKPIDLRYSSLALETSTILITLLDTL